MFLIIKVGRNKTLLAAGLVMIVGVGLLLWSIVFTQAQPAPLTTPQPMVIEAEVVSSEADGTEPTPAPVDPGVVVYISGAVQAPDVYRLPAVARVKDLVLAAGGLAVDADADRVNLAGRLIDGQHVYVPRQGQADPVGVSDNVVGVENSGGMVNLNSASMAELEGLPGIGNAMAQRIIDHRSANGPFGSVDDLANVKGIGPALLAKIAPLVTAGP